MADQAHGAGSIIYNPKTGERMIWDGSKFSPVRTVINSEGDRLVLFNNEWVPPEQYGRASEVTESSPSVPDRTLWDAATEGISNIGSSAVRYTGNLFDAVSHPIDTASALGKAIAGNAQQFGKLAGIDIGDSYIPQAEAFENHMINRYGGWDEIKNTMATDPVGLLGDLSMVFTGLDPVRLAASTAPKVAGKTAHALGLTPEKLYNSALKPSTTLPLADRQRLTRTGLDNKILPNQAGFDRVRELQQTLGDDLGSLIYRQTALEKAGDIPLSINYGDIVNAAHSKVFDKVGYGALPDDALKALNKAREQTLNEYGAGLLTTAQAQDLKLGTQNAVNYGKMETKPTGAGAVDAFQKEIAHGLRTAIEESAPGTAAINQQLSDLHVLADKTPTGGNAPLVAAANRLENNNVLSLPSLILGGSGLSAGAALGGTSGALGAGLGGYALSRALHPMNKARAAIFMNSVRNKAKRITPPNWVGPASRIASPALNAGRLTQESIVPSLNGQSQNYYPSGLLEIVGGM